MDVLQFIVATQYTHTKKTNADCFKVHVFPEKCPLSGRFQSNSFEDLSKKKYQKNQFKRVAILQEMANVCIKAQEATWRDLCAPDVENLEVNHNTWIAQKITFIKITSIMIIKTAVEKLE